MSTSVKAKYIVIDISAPANGGTQKFSRKLPDNLALIEGYLVTTQNEGAIANNEHLGMISVNINNRMSHPVMEPVLSHKRAFSKRKFTFAQLAEPVQGGTYVEGYYKNDLNNAYTVKLYLKGKQIIYHEAK